MIAFWTPRARLDLRELTLYLASYDTRVASKAALDLFERANRLTRHPQMGRLGAEPGTRQLSTPEWKRVMVYRSADGRIEILALKDPRRQTT